MQKSFKHNYLCALAVFLLALPLLAGCGTISYDRRVEAIDRFALSQEPPKDIQRTGRMPLVVAIPGLNLPGAPRGASQFADLNKMLREEGLPSFTIDYDDTLHPLAESADLYSKNYSIAVTRVLPTLARALGEENQIRASQQVSPLQTLDIISYSQGSVLALDLIRNFGEFRKDFQALLDSSGSEWNLLKEDPEFKRLCDVLEDFLVIRNILIQRQREVATDYDLKRLHDRTYKRLEEAFQNFRQYMREPEKLYPSIPIFDGEQTGYPRRYPKTIAWFKSRYPISENPTALESIPLRFFMRYVAFRPFLPLKDIRLFSICGSFFGAGKANKMYPLLEHMPDGLRKFLIGTTENQIRETCLGTKYQLEALKESLAHFRQVHGKRKFEDVYFISGVFGEKGDGLVEQSSSHFSSHMYTPVPVDVLKTASGKPLELPKERFVQFAVTGLPVKHLPTKQFFIFPVPGAAQIEPGNKVFPFLKEFLKKDFEELKRLHLREARPLVQFMVEVTLPKTEEFKDWRLNLTENSPEIRLKNRFYNPDSNTTTWVGAFRLGKKFSGIGEEKLPSSEYVFLTVERPGEKPVEIRFEVNPGVNHFVEFVREAPKEEDLFNPEMEHPVYDWVQEEVPVT